MPQFLKPKVFAATTIFSVVLLALWIFPAFWYTKSASNQQFLWLAERTNLVAWSYRPIPVAESAESILVADRLINGEFKDESGRSIRVFSAKRYQDNKNEIGLFEHTPDRCWTQVGWQIEPVAPNLVTIELHGISIQYERRLFVYKGQRELVYFCGLSGGQPLPFRLDHNLSAGLRFDTDSLDQTGTALRSTDAHLWSRVWESFTSRRPLFGPKQFLRISTPILPGEEQKGDELIQSFLPHWLAPADFDEELAAWHNTRKASPES